jgi:hypothetical protein
MEPKVSKLYRIIFMVFGLSLLTHCGVKGPPITDREDIGPHASHEPHKKAGAKKSSPEKAE